VAGINENRLVADIQYSENLHAPATIERLAESYLDALRAIIAHAIVPVA
jgi:hypothetical protein